MQNPLPRVAATLTASLALATLVAGLVGPAQAQAQPRPSTSTPRPCNPGNCLIKVTVTNCQAPGGITVDNDNVLVNSARNMRWEIVTPGYEFTTDGIRFDPPNPQFEPRNSPKPNEFHIHNKKTQVGDFYYFVNVKGCLPLDPWIRNNN